jgi:predicted solute-binding protein
VNDYSVDLGHEGRRAVQRLFDEAWEKRLIPKKVTFGC